VDDFTTHFLKTLWKGDFFLCHAYKNLSNFNYCLG